jgi:hypothetical protein
MSQRRRRLALDHRFEELASPGLAPGCMGVMRLPRPAAQRFGRGRRVGRRREAGPGHAAMARRLRRVNGGPRLFGFHLSLEVFVRFVRAHP